MQTTETPTTKTVKKKGKRIKLIIIIAVIALLAFASIVFMKKIFSTTDEELIITPHAVEKGDITTIISGTGTVEPIEQYDISSIARGDVIADYITLGQQVNEGDLLYEVDSAEAQNDIEKARISLQKQQLSYEETINSIENLTVTAPINGTIINMYVKNGDSISNNSKICDIVNSITMSITLPFLADDADNISKGQTAYITLDTTDETLTGTVKRITTGSYTTSTGAIVSDVEIVFHNPGAVKPGDTATALVGNFACNQPAEIKYGDQITVVAKTSGEVSNLEYGVGDTIEKDTLLLKLINTSSSTNARSSALSIRDAELALQNQIEALEDYMITSPISGTIIEKTAKFGDTLDGNKSAMAIVADMSKLTFTMSIDELDIKNISKGQEVIVTADALPDQTFTGYIDNISIIGTSSSGVTTYPVDVIIEEYEGLLPGMNVNADIISEQATDILKIPVEAVSRGNLVLVTEEYAERIGAVKSERSRPNIGDAGTDKAARAKSQKPSDTEDPLPINTPENAPPSLYDDHLPTENESDNNKIEIIEMPGTPDGYVWIRITIGMSDKDYVEVTSGLTEDAEIYVVTTKQQREAAENTQRTGMGGMGGMGGMPGGGMPSGGMGSNRSGGGMPSGGMGSNRSGGGMPGGGMR